jgi:hypothetical protein
MLSVKNSATGLNRGYIRSLRKNIPIKIKSQGSLPKRDTLNSKGIELVRPMYQLRVQ